MVLLALIWVEVDARLVRVRRIRRLVGASERDAQITDFRVSPTDDEGVFKYAFKTSNGIDVKRQDLRWRPLASIATPHRRAFPSRRAT